MPRCTDTVANFNVEIRIPNELRKKLTGDQLQELVANAKEKLERKVNAERYAWFKGAEYNDKYQVELVD